MTRCRAILYLYLDAGDKEDDKDEYGEEFEDYDNKYGNWNVILRLE